MCRARSSIRRRPTRVSIEFHRALQASVMVTLNRRTAARLAACQAISDDQAAETVIADLLTTQTRALGIGAVEVDPILSQLGGTAQPLFVKRREP